MEYGTGHGSWRRDLPFFILAVIAHCTVVAVDPSWRWGAAAPAPEQLIPVDFVSAPPSNDLAMVPPGNGDKDLAPGYGLGPFEPEKVRKPAQAAGKKKTVRKPALSPRTKAARRAAVAQRRAAERQRLSILAAARAEVARQKAEAAVKKRREAFEMARFLAGQKAIKARRLAVERAARARKQADISRELAQMADPDETLADAVNDDVAPVPSKGSDLAPAAGRDDTASPDEGGGLGQGGGDVSWSLDGPVGTRRIISRALPESPDWVGQRGLELAVQVRFQVLCDGSVDPGVVVKKTSGFPEIDRRALQAIRRWRFEKSSAPAAHPTWGSVRFKFTTG